MSVPGWPSIHEVENEVSPHPYPGCISDFDAARTHYRAACEDARGEILRIDDCVKHSKATIREQAAYIVRVQKIIAEYQADLARAKRKGESDSALARISEKIEIAQLNIDNAREQITEAESAIKVASALRKPWAEEWERRRDLWREISQNRRKGLDSSGNPKLCRSRKTVDGQPCGNESRFRPGAGWGGCHLHP